MQILHVQPKAQKKSRCPKAEALIYFPSGSVNRHANSAKERNRMIQQTKSQSNSNIYCFTAAKPLSNTAIKRHNRPAAFNQAAKVSQPWTVRQTAADFSKRLRGLFTSAIALHCLFHGRQGQGGFMPAGTNCQYCEPCLLSAAFAFHSVKNGCIDQLEKAHSMQIQAPNPPVQTGSYLFSILKQTHLPNVQNLHLHHGKNAPNICAAAFNQAVSREKLDTKWQTAAFSHELRGFLTSAIALHCLFHGRQGQGKHNMLAGFTLPVSHPLPHVCRPFCREKRKAVLKNQSEKACSMQTQSLFAPIAAKHSSIKQILNHQAVKNHLPNTETTRQNCAVAFNQAASRRKLLQTGKPAVSFAIDAIAAIFTLAHPLKSFRFMAGKGKARLYAAATVWQFPTPYPLLATPNRRKLGAALSANRKAFIMQTATSLHTIQIQTPMHTVHAVANYAQGKLAIWRKAQYGAIYSEFPAHEVSSLKAAKAIIQSIYFHERVI